MEEDLPRNPHTVKEAPKTLRPWLTALSTGNSPKNNPESTNFWVLWRFHLPCLPRMSRPSSVCPGQSYFWKHTVCRRLGKQLDGRVQLNHRLLRGVLSSVPCKPNLSSIESFYRRPWSIRKDPQIPPRKQANLWEPCGLKTFSSVPGFCSLPETYPRSRIPAVWTAGWFLTARPRLGSLPGKWTIQWDFRTKDDSAWFEGIYQPWFVCTPVSKPESKE